MNRAQARVLHRIAAQRQPWARLRDLSRKQAALAREIAAKTDWLVLSIPDVVRLTEAGKQALSRHWVANWDGGWDSDFD